MALGTEGYLGTRAGPWDGQEEVAMVACLLGHSSIQEPQAQKELAACRSHQPASDTMATSTPSLCPGHFLSPGN